MYKTCPQKIFADNFSGNYWRAIEIKKCQTKIKKSTLNSFTNLLQILNAVIIKWLALLLIIITNSIILWCIPFGFFWLFNIIFTRISNRINTFRTMNRTKGAITKTLFLNFKRSKCMIWRS